MSDPKEDLTKSEEAAIQKGCVEYIVAEDDFKFLKTLKTSEDRFRKVDLVKKVRKTDDEPEDPDNYVRIQLNSTDGHIFGKQIDLFVHTEIHPAIVQFEGFEYYPHHFAITKHYPNGSLQHTLKEKPAFWDGTMKSKCVYGLVAAVTHIHNTYDETEEDFSIRYLCPENIIFDDQNEPRLINYVFKDEVLGKTPNAYIPPELHENPEGSRYDEDVWALGMILYEILTGHKPYNDLENEEKVKEAVVSGTLPKFPPPSPETDNIIGIIQNCLDKVPTNRPLPYMILHHLSNLSEDLFPGTDKESYNSYRNRVQEATLNSDESYAYISKVITDEVDNEDLLAKIKAGDTQAMIRLGRMYQKGLGGYAVDENQAYDYYLQAAKLNDSIGLYNAALCLSQGRGVAQDLKKSFEFMEKSAKSGLEKAVCDYGCMVRDGCGTKADLKKAIEIFRDAADNHNNKLCQYILGTMYYDGNEVIKKDINKGLTYLRKSAQNGNPTASADIAFHYYTLGLKDPSQMTKAINLYKKAARQKSPIALTNLGRIYKDGKYVTQDLKEAAELFKQAAKCKDITGMIEYGVCLKNGFGVPKDPKGAASYYQQAAQAGDKRGQHNYAKLLYDGERGVPKDILTASKFFKLAADQGVPPSMFYYAKIVINGEGGVVRDPAKGKRYLEKYNSIVPEAKRIAGWDELLRKTQRRED